MLERKEKTKIYKEVAKEYLEGGKTLHQICKTYEAKIGFFPMINTARVHIKKLREKRKRTEFSKLSAII